MNFPRSGSRQKFRIRIQPVLIKYIYLEIIKKHHKFNQKEEIYLPFYISYYSPSVLQTSVADRVADPERFDADPDPTFKADADPDPNPFTRVKKEFVFKSSTIVSKVSQNLS